MSAAAKITAVILSYFIGCLNGAILYSKFLRHDDVRTHGSGNAGATNVLRTFGKAAGFGVLFFDLFKGVAVVIAARLCGFAEPIVLCCAFAAILGHNYPIFEKFKGGKGVAVSVGVSMAINWKVTLPCLILGVSIILITKLVSLGSLIGTCSTPISSLIQGYPTFYLFFWVAMCSLCAYRHRSNIVRLLNKTESRIKF